MGRLRTSTGLACTAALVVLGTTACGDSTHLPQAPSQSPFMTSSVTVVQQGNADVTIDPASATFKLDDSRNLVVHLSLRSNSAKTATVAVRGSLYDPSHQLVGDVSGGQINVAPGGTAALQLTGPAPNGTIASATFEATAQPSPT